MDTHRPDAAVSRYVGRRRELTTIEAALAGALSGSGRVVLVAGDPGIGKSRLLAEAERVARERDVPVAWGRSPEAEGAPPFWPWRQVLRTVDDLASAGTAGDRDRSALAYRIAPELANGDDVGAGGAELQAAERFGVFESFAELVRGAASSAGLVVLLDDIHWADAASLRLLEHVAHDWAKTPALLIAAHRPAGGDRDAPLRETLAVLSRIEGMTRIELKGFTVDETAARLADVTGRAFAPASVASLQRRTNGNPFFVSEFGHLLDDVEHGGFDTERDVPPSVRDVIARRVRRMSRRTQDVLQVAAIVGAQPAPALVSAVLDMQVPDVLESFDEAAGDGLITRDDTTSAYTFSHALLRDALYTEVATGERMRVHARVAEHLEQVAGPDARSNLSEIAHHWLRAMPAGHADSAARSAAAAAEADMAQLAYEEAARLYEAAARAAAQTSTGGARGAHLLLRAARARLLSGELDASAALCDEVARLARASGDMSLLADAALVIEGVGDRQLSAVIAGLCEEALAALPADEVQTRSRLLAQLTTASVYLEDHALLDRHSREALDGAERSGDADTLVAALRARHIACSDAAGLDERIGVTERLLQLAQDARRPVDEVWARLWRFDAAMQQGRVADCEREILSIELLADRIKQPLIWWHLERCRFCVAHARGDFDAARRAADGGDRFARSAGELARRRRPMQYLILSVATGDDLGDAFPAVDMSHARTGDTPMPQTALLIASQTTAIAAAFRGERERAAAIYDGLPGPDRWSVMPPAVLIASAHRALLAALLDRRDDCAAMYARLAPYADLFASAGAGAIACFGSIELPLGLLARTLGRHDAAIGHLQRAVERSDQAGMRPSAAESRYQLALALHTRGRSGDLAQALPLASASLDEAERLGMRPLAGRATALRETLRAGTRQARRLTPREMEIAKMVAEGLTSREVAEAMHISSRTADNHVQHILDKLDLRSRSQIAAWVVRELRTGA